MEGLVRSALGEHAVLRVAAGLERDDARHVRFERQHLQVEHQLDVLGVRNRARRPAHRAISRGSPLLLRDFDGLDAAFELVNVVEIAIEPRAIGRAELAAQAGHLARDPVEDAAGGFRGGRGDRSAVVPAPNSMSKATRGSRIIGSGSFGDAQLSESV